MTKYIYSNAISLKMSCTLTDFSLFFVTVFNIVKIFDRINASTYRDIENKSFILRPIGKKIQCIFGLKKIYTYFGKIWKTWLENTLIMLNSLNVVSNLDSVQNIVLQVINYEN